MSITCVLEHNKVLDTQTLGFGSSDTASRIFQCNVTAIFSQVEVECFSLICLQQEALLV